VRFGSFAAGCQHGLKNRANGERQHQCQTKPEPYMGKPQFFLLFEQNQDNGFASMLNVPSPSSPFFENRGTKALRHGILLMI
jgi:hypothetical protein